MSVIDHSRNCVSPWHRGDRGFAVLCLINIDLLSLLGLRRRACSTQRPVDPSSRCPHCSMSKTLPLPRHVCAHSPRATRPISLAKYLPRQPIPVKRAPHLCITPLALRLLCRRHHRSATHAEPFSQIFNQCLESAAAQGHKNASAANAACAFACALRGRGATSTNRKRAEMYSVV